jgi:hypothetical protein
MPLRGGLVIGKDGDAGAHRAEKTAAVPFRAPSGNPPTRSLFSAHRFTYRRRSTPRMMPVARKL